MKRIVQVAVLALSFSAASAWSQQEKMEQAQGAAEEVSVAQASPIAERGSIQRDEPRARSRKPSMYASDLAADGSFPSRGGPVDD